MFISIFFKKNLVQTFCHRTHRHNSHANAILHEILMLCDRHSFVPLAKTSVTAAKSVMSVNWILPPIRFPLSRNNEKVAQRCCCWVHQMRTRSPLMSMPFEWPLPVRWPKVPNGRQEVAKVVQNFAKPLVKHLFENRLNPLFKSSKFLDDRFVLKEMSKTDLAIFENFAPNYFEYISQCLTARCPTLLAKIYGVFRVIIKKKELIYLEHSFHYKIL